MTFARLLLILGLLIAAIYLFVQAPAPLPDGPDPARDGTRVSALSIFDAANTINAEARKIYTRDVVSAGMEAGLAFGEDWEEAGVDKGPLPALFLRKVAFHLEAKPERLGLFLGSDRPINPSNLFSGPQGDHFAAMMVDGAPKYFSGPGFGEAAMFADYAVVQGCVTCHNDHEDSPEQNWQLGDLMGATTWTYPDASVPIEEYLEVLEAVYAAVDLAYRNYVRKTQSFGRPPALGPTWPDPGEYRIPDPDTFMAAVREASATSTLSHILSASPDPSALPNGSP
jgi:hypothetical protein